MTLDVCLGDNSFCSGDGVNELGRVDTKAISEVDGVLTCNVVCNEDVGVGLVLLE